MLNFKFHLRGFISILCKGKLFPKGVYSHVQKGSFLITVKAKMKLYELIKEMFMYYYTT